MKLVSTFLSIVLFPQPLSPVIKRYDESLPVSLNFMWVPSAVVMSIRFSNVNSCNSL